jgi:hypothetical protein
MKKVIFVAYHFGFWSTISAFSQASFQKALGLLEYGYCDHIFLAVDYENELKKSLTKKHLQDCYFKHMESEFAKKVRIVITPDDNVAHFVQYIKEIAENEILLDIFAEVGEKGVLARKIDDFTDSYAGKIPLIFMSGSCRYT